MGDEADMFGGDPVRTLGEILAYCQVMYEAIQKLDEKIEVLQARVVHKQEEPPSLQIYTPESAPFCSPENLLHHRTSPDVPHPTEHQSIFGTCDAPETTRQVRSQPPASAATRPRTVREMLLEQHHISPDDEPISNTKAPRSVKEILQQRRKRSDPPSSRRSKTHTATPGMKFVIPSGVVARASAILRPTAAARFLLQSLFTQQELLHGSVRGHTAKGLKKLHPGKMDAIREWVQKAYPKLDFSEEGKAWKACTAVMNEGTRSIRLKDRKRKLQEVAHGVLQKESRAQEVGEQELEATPAHDFQLEPAAEVDVELSDSDGDELQRLMARRSRLKSESDKEDESEREESSEVYLGSPARDVRVPRDAMLSAFQRRSPALVARHLIRFLFPEDLLVQSNVYGNSKHGIQPLDHNKISALRDETLTRLLRPRNQSSRVSLEPATFRHLCERFPALKLNEDGPSWRACVLAINSTIRKTRHARKKGGTPDLEPTP